MFDYFNFLIFSIINDPPPPPARPPPPPPPRTDRRGPQPTDDGGSPGALGEPSRRQPRWQPFLESATQPLMALSSATAILDSALPERAPCPALFEKLEALIGNFDKSGWQVNYIRWELELLAELGFGLDLSRCAATGSDQDLIYVSPRTGRAVSAEAGRNYQDRLLSLPKFLIEDTNTDISGPILYEGLKLTGHFLGRHVLSDTRYGLPAARGRLADGLRRQPTHKIK